MAEMKAGYKQTDIGVIPEDWDVKPIGSCIWNMRGGAPLKPSDFQKSGIKVLPKGAICKGGIIKLKDSDTQFCALSYFNKHTSNQVDSRFTIVVLRDLVPSGPTIGTVVRNQYEKPFLLAQGVYGFLVNDQLLHDGYLIQLSNSAEYRRTMQSIMVGSTQVHITNGAFKNVQIPVPKPEEQKAIAAALADVDGLIVSLEQLVTKKRDMKTAAMQQLLTGQKRLPGFDSSKGYRQTDIGVIPKDWDISPLGNLSRISMGQSPLSKFYNIKGIGLPLVQGNADIKNRKTIIRQYSAQTTKLGKQNEIILTVRAPVGAVAKATFNCCLGRGVCSIRYPNDYLFYYLQNLEAGWAKYTSGSTFDSINSDHVKKILIPLPKPEEQTAISTVLSDMDSEIDALEQRLEKARSLKTGMMQALLTGKTRLITTDKKQEVV